MDSDTLKTIIDDFQFAQPDWLWGLVLLPLLWLGYALLYRHVDGGTKLEKFADAHLLPHLLGEEAAASLGKSRVWRALMIWSLVWGLGLLAMAGPRWDYTDVKAFAPARNLVILLDMSRSMDAQDVKPSRLARARQEIQDIDSEAKGMNIGLIAFASVPHVITPLTDDRETLNRLLPSLNTGLVYTQGSNIVPALRRASEMLSVEPGREKHILIISDGGFHDGAAAIYRAEKDLEKQNIRVHVMGVGTEQGAPVPNGKGGYEKQNGTAVIAKLDRKQLKQIAQDGKGLYLDASYLDNDTKAALSRVNIAAEKEVRKTTRFWEERFYIFLAPLALLLLPWFRRNAVFPVLLLFMILNTAPAHAAGWRDLFLNKAQQGEKAVSQKQYDQAEQKFSDPYRRGVAQYKAGKYTEAEKSFAAADRPEVKESARYNLGNAQLMGGKIDEAIKSYEQVLKDDPHNDDAKHNLEIAKKLKDQQKKQQQNKNQNQKNQQDKNQQNQQGGQGQQDQKNQNGSQQKQSQNGQNKDQNGKPQNGQDQKDQNGENQKGQQGQQAQNRQNQNKKDQGQQGQQGDQKKDEQQQQGKNGSRQQADKDKEQQEKNRQSAADQQQKDQQQQQQAGRQGEENKDQQQQARQAQPGQASDDENGKPVKPVKRTQQDIDADQWLNRIQNNPQQFLKNKFYIESKRQGAQQGDNPW